MSRPIVAIIGRPNVGKSTLFNRLVGERRAIVEGIPGTTRDRLYGVTEWNGMEFVVVDTAGLLWHEDEEGLPIADITRRAREQATLAIESADAIILVVDGREGLTSADADVAEVVRPTQKPVILAVNKADSKERQFDAVEFYALNLGEPIPMSAYHSSGVGDVLDRITEALTEAGLVSPPKDSVDTGEHIRVALLGRPNVGKSSLLNRLLGEERSVVSFIPGTTRDSIDTELVYHKTPMTLIDTAGIRRAGKVERGIEKYSVLRALRAIERCDVAMLLIDATEGVTAQDTHIAGMVLEANKGIAILVNKWDLVEKDTYTHGEYTQQVRDAFRFLDYAPVLFISALSGQRVDRILQLAREIADERRKRVPTGQLNDLLRDALMKQPPTATKKGAHVRIYYATQPQTEPPVFLFFTNNRELVHWSYARYLENRIRERYGFGGTPIVIVFRDRERKPPKETTA